MSRAHRFPRYAPEALERRLSPSLAVPTTPVAIVCGMGVPTPMPTPMPPRPPGGTDPAPPDGNGEPPIEDPNIPVGPDLPAYA